MASGLCAALTGRTHGCTDQPANVKKTLANSEPSTHANVKKTLANSEPSTHGTKRTYRGKLRMSAFEVKRTSATP
jgi:hypothetical protein